MGDTPSSRENFDVIGRQLVKYVYDLQTLPADAAAAWRSAGVSGALTEVRQRTVDRAGGYGRYIVVEADLTLPYEISSPTGVEIRQFRGGDWSSLGDLVGFRLAPAFSAAIEAGRICLVAWRGSEALGYIWFSPAIQERHESFALRLPADANYLWQLQVVRSARRQGIGAALACAGFQRALEHGLRRSWMITRPGNTAFQATIASVAPAMVLGSISRVKVASWMQSHYHPLHQPLPLHPLRQR